MPDSRYPTESQRRTFWSALTGLAIGVMGALVVGLVFVTAKLLNYLQPVLVPLAVAGILAYLLNPVVRKLEEKGASRLRAIIYVFASGAVCIALCISLALPPLIEELTKLYQNRVQIGHGLMEKVESTEWSRSALNWLNEPHKNFHEEAAELPEGEQVAWEKRNIGVWTSKLSNDVLELSSIMSGAGKVFGFIGYGLGFLLVPVYLFFFLKETGSIQRRWKDFVPLKKSHLKTEVVETLTEMNGYLIAFFRGQVLVSIIDGVLTGLLLWMIGLDYAIVIGIALAILGVMPFIGFLVTLIPALIIAAAQWGDWQHPLLVLGIFFLVQQIDGLFIQPKIIGDKVGLHPMTIIFSIFFWSLLLGGFLGALLAVPLTASVKVLFTRYVWERATFDTPFSAPGQPADP